MLKNELIKKILSRTWHSFASKAWFMPFLLLYAKQNVKPYKSESDAKIRILALNDFRYTHDLEILNNHPDICIYTLPHSVQTLINALFYRDLPSKINVKDNTEKYAIFSSLENESERSKLVSYLEVFIPKLLNSLNIDAIMSCSFFYIADIDWQRAFANTNTPYFALHK